MDYSVEKIKEITTEAKIAAEEAATTYFNEVLGGEDSYACGFAWVNLYEKGNTKLGRAMKKAGLKQDHTRAFNIWNPSGLNCQNVDTKVVGARAAAAVFANYGFKAYADSRLD